MNNIIKTHEKEIFELFKTKTKTLQKKNINLDFDKIINEVLSDLNIFKVEISQLTLFKKWFESIYSSGFLTELIDNHQFQEIIIHSHDFYQINYQDHKESRNVILIECDDYQTSLEFFAEKNKIEWNYLNPFSSFDYSYHNSKYRLTLIHFSITSKKVSKLFIRQHHFSEITINDFSTNENVPNILNEIIIKKSNTLIVGSTGSGKTSLLNSMIGMINPTDHLIIIEDTKEISTNSSNITHLISNEKAKGFTLSDYCSYAMRMSPDRVILGEMRSIEVVPFLLAMNSGQNGLLSTIHANSAYDAISRIKLLFAIYNNEINLNPKAVTELVCKNIEYIIFIKNKKIEEIIKVLGIENEIPFTEQIYLNCA